MGRISLHMNVTQGGANLHPGVDLYFCTPMQKLHMNTALVIVERILVGHRRYMGTGNGC